MIIQRIGGTTTTPRTSKKVIQRINVGPALQKQAPTPITEITEPIQITPGQKKNVIPNIKYVSETIIKGIKLTLQDIKKATPTAVPVAKKTASSVIKAVVNSIPPVYAYNVNKKAQTPEGRKELADKANAVWKFISPEPLMGLEPGTITPKRLGTSEGRKDLAYGISTLMSAIGFATLPTAGPISQLVKPGLVTKNIIIGGAVGGGLSTGITWLAGEEQNWWNNAAATVIGMYFGAAVPEKQLTMKQAQILDAKSTLEKYGISNKEEYIKWTQKNHPDTFPEALRPKQQVKMTEVNNAIADLGKNSLGVGDKIPKAPATLSDTIKWSNDLWKRITNPPSKTGRAIVPYQPPIEDVIPVGEYTYQEIAGKIIGSGLEKTPEGKQVVKLALEAQQKGQNIVVSSAGKVSEVVPTEKPPAESITEAPEAKKPVVEAPKPTEKVIKQLLPTEIKGIGEVKPKTVSVPREQLPVGEGKEQISRLEARVKEGLKNIPQEKIDELGLPTYKQMNKEENIFKATEYVFNNPEEALQVLSGEIEAPKGILRNSIYLAMEKYAKGDVDLARRLASLESTRLGQEISILTELDPYSPVKIMRDIIKVRAKAVERKYAGRDIKEVTKKQIQKGEAMIKPPTRFDWASVIERVRC